MRKENISSSVIRRLPRYFRYLNDLSMQGVTRISSQELSVKMKLTASQIRQDLNCFGGFGQQGYGYNIDFLLSEIKHILGADRETEAIILGLGNMGMALANNMKFDRRGVVVTGLFDIDPEKIGKIIRGIPVSDMKELEDFCKTRKPRIAILTLPKNAVSETAHKLFESGVKAFWNFSNVELDIEGAMVENVHLGDSLMNLCYNIVNREGNTETE